MALSIDWLGIAEASASDARGALTLIGVGQNVIVAPSFPHREQRVLVVTALDDDGSELKGAESSVSLGLEIKAPSGKTLLANTQVVPLAQASNPSMIPADVEARGFQLVLTLNLEVTEFGAHTIRVVVTVDDVEAERQRRIYVVKPPVDPIPA